MTENEALTIEELKKMAGLPVWCPDEEAYGIVMCDSIGEWAGIPFLHGVWYHDGIGTEFNHNIIRRKLKCYRVINEKTEINMPTAYDVDAVVERLEKEKQTSTSAKAEAIIGMCGASANHYGGEECAYQRAIEIVKGGGADGN